MKEAIELVIKYSVSGLTAILGVWVGFYLNRNQQEKVLTRQSLSALRPSIVDLIKVSVDIHNYYSAESDDIHMRKELHIKYTVTSLHEKFVAVKDAFENKSFEIIDLVSPEKKRLISMASVCALGVQLFLPSEPAHPNFYIPTGGNNHLQQQVKKLLNVLDEI